MSEKISGYLLLVGGLALIVFAGLSVYQVFTGTTPPVQLFHLSAITYNPSTAQLQLPPMEIMPAAAVNQYSNITAHIILMSFLAGIGFKIASLGTYLLRPISVKLRSDTLKE
jgi:hypothetical protein